MRPPSAGPSTVAMRFTDEAQATASANCSRGTRKGANEVTAGADWPPEFFEKLAKGEPELVDAVSEMSKAIHAGRRSKGPPRL